MMKSQKRSLIAILTALFFISNSISSFAVVEPNQTNLLGNPSFEETLGGAVVNTLQQGELNPPSTIFRGNWDNTANRGLSTPSSPSAVEGQKVLQLTEFGATNVGSFTFQTLVGTRVGEGVFATFSIFYRFVGVQNGATFPQIQMEFQDANGTQISATNSGDLAVTTTFTKASISASAPAGTKQITFTIRLQGDVDSTEDTTVQFDQAVGTISSFPIVIDASASKPSVSRGSPTFVSARIKNISAVNFTNLEAVVKVPEGFNFIDSASRLDGFSTTSREGSRIFSLGNLSAAANHQLGFLLVPSSMVQIGKRYEVSILIRETATGIIRSATRSLIIIVQSDPLFDEGTIVGKVFDDQNENQTQDKGEYGVPGVKIATEQGIVVVTDPNGRFHIPAIRPGRHIVKIDGHTLPRNTKFVTEESVLIKTTDGMLNVVNYACKLPEPQIPKQYRDQLKVFVTQGTDTSVPHLSIVMDPNILRMGIGYFEKDPTFRINTNYAELISGWRIEIKDEYGEEVWTGYGLGSPPKEAPWTGKTKSKEPIGSGVYSYRLIVRDREGHEDWTPLSYFRVISKLDRFAPENPTIEVPASGNMTIEREGKRSIPTSGRPTLQVRGTTVPWNSITVNGEPVGVNLDGSFQTELFVPPGRQSITIMTTDPEGNAVSYQEEVVVKDSYFFMVGLGEEELGGNIIHGNPEVVGRDDKFHHGFYQDGRLAYYLKAKIKGRFLVTSRYDTDDPRRELFTNLDPDAYYPVYGDDSQIQYDAYDTKQRFYVLIEMDRSALKWGSYNTNFTDTELSQNNRTFSGLKIRHESLASTRYGDSRRGFIVFTADSDQMADHNEFSGTGGSLFYLRNKNVIQGSEKIRVEVRDKIQGIATQTYDLVNGNDYEIDYPAGRVILRKPLSAVSYSDTIISNDILNGSETFLIVDYEFDPQGFVSDRNSGLRGFTHLGDHFRVGGTAIEEKRDGLDYDLRGVDFVSKFGRNTKVTAEYARTQNRNQRNSISYNGGITFADVPTGNSVLKKSTQLFDDAYLIKAQTKAKTGTEISGYAQQINAGFANANLISQAGTRKGGIELRQKAGEHAQLMYRFDRLKATDPNNLANVYVTSPKDQKVHTAQLKADYERYLGILEYRNQELEPYSVTERDLAQIIDDVTVKDLAAVKFGYRVNQDVMPYAKAQTGWKGTGGPNNQFGGGIEAKVMKGKGTVRLEEMLGTVGDSTLLGFDVQSTENSSVYTNLQTGPAADRQGRVMTTTIGSSTQVNEKSRFYSERELSSYRTGDRSANVMGYDTKLNEHWGVDASFERSHLYDIQEVDSHRNAGAMEISYLEKDYLKVISRYELRYDGGTDDRLQWFFRDTVDWKINPDYSFAVRFDRSDTNQFAGPTSFNNDATFTELDLGLAYRPVQHNRLNVLTRYSWIQEVGAESQFNTPDIFAIATENQAHVFGAEFGYDVFPRLMGLVQKFAYRRSTLAVEGDAFYIGNFLWVNRFNFHVVRKWDLAIEYRMLWDTELLEAMKHGALLEIDREIAEYMRFGLGYNFTDFDDDLRSLNDFGAHGFFTRVSGKF